MNGINELPGDTMAGLDFDYSRWHPDTEITLCTVEWDNSYADVVEFDSDDDLNEYIDSLPSSRTLKIGQMTYVTPSLPIKIDVPHNVAHRYNYVRVRNPIQPVDGDIQRDLYYFILNTQRRAPETTEILVQLDVWQTYRRMVKFLRAFIDTGHIGVANSQQDEMSGRKWLTTPEGLDTGSEYAVTDMATVGSYTLFDVLITSTTNLVASPGTSSAPVLRTAAGGYTQSIPTPTTTYRIAGNQFQQYMAAMSNYPWITQGIVRVVLVPRLSQLGIPTTPVERTNNYPPGPAGSPDSFLERLGFPTGGFQYKTTVPFEPGKLQDNRMKTINQRYRYLRKFATSPYMYLEVSTGFGDDFTYRPELFPPDVETADMGFSFIPGSERIEFSVSSYNAGDWRNYGDQYSAAVCLNNLPTLPVVNNMALAGLAASAHSRAAARANIDWSHQLAFAGADAAYQNARLGATTAYQNEQANMGLSANLQSMQQQTARQNAAIGLVGGMAGGAAGGAMMGGGPGAAVGATGGVVGSASNAWQLLNSQDMERRSLQASLNVGGANLNRSFDASMGMAESNKGLAEFAANGSYEASIRSLTASVRDTMLTQPGMSGQFGGEFLRLMQKSFRFECRVKSVDEGTVNRLGEYWLRYGYKVSTFAKLPENLLVMSKFSYWKLHEVYLDAAHVPELFKQALRGILEKGVTLWASPDMIGTTDPATNIPKNDVVIQNGA